MKRMQWIAALGFGLLAAASPGWAQRPYIGFVYPAGGQQGTVFQVKLGGQGLAGVEGAVITGPGVATRIVEYNQKIGPQEVTLLREQLAELKKKARQVAAVAPAQTSSPGAKATPVSNQKAIAQATSGADAAMMSSDMAPMMGSEMNMMMGGGGASPTSAQFAIPVDGSIPNLMARIEKRIAEYVQQPASASVANLVIVEVKIAPNAEPGEREIRLLTPRGVTNPMVFYVGQVRETCRKPMITSMFQVLGKEHLSQRKRPDDEVEVRVTVPCTMNGQIATGEVNKYRFQARKGQRLVISSLARQLIPYIADAVPGWFQPVVTLHDADGNEVSYGDDYRFRPDPVMLFEVPKDGEYVLSIFDAIYRGREDFVYRITIGEVPFLTGIFPLGGPAGASPTIAMKGWNLDKAVVMPPAKGAAPGIHQVAAVKGGLQSNRVPFAVDTLPECLDKEDNNTVAKAQKVQLPIIVNGRIDREDDRDVFQFAGRAGDMVVAEVMARRLDSPLDSQIRLTDAAGKIVAFNDDVEDLGAGLNTHHADSYIMTKLPADGTYHLHLADTARNGGEEFSYRLRISAPRPDFALRVVPSSIALRSKSGEAVSVFAIRQDGFTNAIRLALKDPPSGFAASQVSLVGTQQVARVTIKTDLKDTKEPVNLSIEGRANVASGEIARTAVPSEDRMQAFLWRHLVPAKDLKALVYDPNHQPPPKRVSKLVTTNKP